MARTIRLENPEIWGGIVDVDESAPAELLARILTTETGAGEDDQAVYRRGMRHVPRLRPGVAPAVTLTRFEGDTSHLVIGATGNVGPYLIRQLAEMGANTVVAVSRGGAGQLAELGTELKAFGTALVEVAADAADEAAMTKLFERFGADLPPLEGVYLAALTGSESLITEMSDADVNTMFRSKASSVRGGSGTTRRPTPSSVVLPTPAAPSAWPRRSSNGVCGRPGPTRNRRPNRQVCNRCPTTSRSR
jgi:hypothetical protein